jgi:hypothetical protein
MKPSVLKALERVASLSAESANLVGQLKSNPNEQITGDNTATIAKLTSSITQLNSELSLLRMEAIPVDAVLSDSEIENFTTSFEEYLSKSTNIKTTLLGFTRTFFLPYSPPVRVVIANTILNYCTKNDLSASDLWRDIVANTGYL